jgi:tetratricopeptide (TPR) repeat protein
MENESTPHLLRPGRGVFLVALAVRLLFLQQFSGSPFFVPVAGGNDRSLYVTIAQGVASGGWFPDGAFQHMPLYGWFLGALFAVAGPAGLHVAAFAGALLDSLTAALIARLAMRHGAPAVGVWLGGLLYAFYPMAIAYSALTMPNTLNAFLLLAVTAGVSRLDRNAPAKRWLLTGLLAGISCLGFAGMLLVVVACLLYFLIPRFSAAPSRLALFALGAALPLAPVAVHNTRAGGEFILITGHGGFNFYMGNHEGATGYPMQIAGFRGDAGSLLADARREAERVAGRTLTAREASRFWSDKAWAFIREEPTAAARLFGLKLLRFVNFKEYDDLRVLPMLRLTGTAFTSPLWIGFWAIAAMGLFGLVVSRGCLSVKFITLAAVVSIASFFVTSRYRLTIAPLFCVLGAVSLREFLPPFRFPSSVFRQGLPALLAVALVLIPLPQADFRALDHYNAAAHLLDRGLAEEALRISLQGLEIDPEEADLHFTKANALFGLQKLPEAAAAYESAIRLNPRHAQAHFNLAVVRRNMGDAESARRGAERALELDPDFSMAREFLKALAAPRPANP